MDKHGISIFALALLALAGCSDDAPAVDGAAGEPAMTHILLQADWYAEPEHGGFYQALQKGYYRDAGLDVEIVPLGSMVSIYAVVAGGQADMGMGTSDNLLIARAQGVPLKAVIPYFQHDPQGVMVHRESGITELKQLDGRDVMISPILHYVDFLDKGLGIHMNMLPVDGGVGRFVADKQFAQQAFLTSEPWVAMQGGADPVVLPFCDTGYDPYRLVFTSEKFAAEHPEAVQAFIDATKRGWQSFLSDDRSEVYAMISALNPVQTTQSMDWSFGKMQEYQLGQGHPEHNESLGQLQVSRLQKQIDQLQQLGLLAAPITVDDLLLRELYPIELLVE
jgi:NitT/TauT family transport system substrate-binding protein